MSKLEYYARPLVAFDPGNKEHRRFYHEFIKTNTWGRCPVRFICPNESGMDLVRMMQKQLVEWYVSQEFKGRKIVKDKSPRRGKKSLGLTQGGYDLTM